jgi:GAF domain-containing protein
MASEMGYFKTLCQVSKVFGTTLEKGEILDLIVRSAVDTMGGKAACLFLADEEQDVFVPVAEYGLSESYLHAKPMQAKRVVDDVLKGGYLSVYDATTDPRLENHEAKKAEGIASILVVPVMVRDKAIGVLSLYSESPRDFAPEEADFLTALAEHGGMAIERALLLERLHKNAALYEDLASTINSSLDIKKVLHILTSDIAEALEMKGALIRLLNREAGSLDLVASYGLSEEFLSKGPVAADDNVRRALGGETVVVKDVSTDPGVLYREATLKEGIFSMIVAPIKSADEVIGMLALCSGEVQEFPGDTVRLVTALAHQGGLAIRNASVYLMLLEDKKSLEDEIWSHKAWF